MQNFEKHTDESLRGGYLIQPYVLIADGASLLAMRVASYFRVRGFRVELVADGLECIESMQLILPDVVILDCELLWGGCDGVLSWLQDHPVRSQVPVVLTTELSCPQKLHPSVVSQIRRPFDVVTLLKAVNSAIARTAKTY